MFFFLSWDGIFFVAQLSVSNGPVLGFLLMNIIFLASLLVHLEQNGRCLKLGGFAFLSYQ